MFTFFMIIVWINLTWTTLDLDLMDGSVAILIDWDIKIAISEERLSRKKYDGWFKKSLNYCLNNLNLKLENIDYFWFSICCDVPLNIEHIQYILRYNWISIPDNKIITLPSHHLSHAYSCFIPSKFEKSLILVADNEWNILWNKIDKYYWGNSLERISYYIWNNNDIHLIWRDCDWIWDLWLWIVYSFFTRWLWWESYQEAWKIMWLAPYWNKFKFKWKNLFELDKKWNICVNIEPINTEIWLSIRRFFYKNWWIEIWEWFKNLKNPTQLQKDISYYLQDQLEKILIKKIKFLTKKTWLKSLCISWWVALNCVVNNKILEQTDIKNIYIMPASWDQWQCIWNCFYIYYNFLNNIKNKCNFTPYLWKKYSNIEIYKEINNFKEKLNIEKYNTKQLIKKVALLITKWNIIWCFQWGSEFWPRALWNRSILADPRNKDMKNIINNRIKHREYFRPFAPAILEEYYNKYFKSTVTKTPYMLLAPKANKITFKNAPSIVHKDLTSRVQTVSKNDNLFFYNLIYDFFNLTNVPILLNTSFNDNWEPIIESPEDAISSFINLDLDYLVIWNYLLSKK